MKTTKQKYEVRSLDLFKKERHPACIVAATSDKEAAELFALAHHSEGQKPEDFRLTVFDDRKSVTHWNIHVSKSNTCYTVKRLTDA